MIRERDQIQRDCYLPICGFSGTNQRSEPTSSSGLSFPGPPFLKLPSCRKQSLLRRQWRGSKPILERVCRFRYHHGPNYKDYAAEALRDLGEPLLMLWEFMSSNIKISRRGSKNFATQPAQFLYTFFLDISKPSQRDGPFPAVISITGYPFSTDSMSSLKTFVKPTS